MGHSCSSKVICVVILKVRVFHVVEVTPAEIRCKAYRALKYVTNSILQKKKKGGKRSGKVEVPKSIKVKLSEYLK